MTFKRILALILTLAMTMLLSNVGVTDAAEKENIDIEGAQRIAFNAAFVNVEDIHKLKVERNESDGDDYYEIEFESYLGKYELEVQAATGKIMKSNIDYKDDDEVKQTVGKSLSEIKEIAYDLSAIDSLHDVYELEIELDEDDGSFYYDVEFKSTAGDYEYKIDAETGEILKQGRDTQMLSSPPELAIEQAIEKAYAAAELESDRSVYDLDAELDEDDGHHYYEIEFKSYSGEYEFEIDATSGDVLKKDIDAFDDDDDDDYIAGHRMVHLSLAEAKQIAYEDATLEADEFVYKLQVEFDDDGGLYYYEIEFKTNRGDYEYEVHADTGEVLKREIAYGDFDDTDYDEDDDTDYDDDDDTYADTHGMAYTGAMWRAINEARISVRDVYELKIERDFDGQGNYKIEMMTNRGVFKYEIGARGGRIRQRDVDYDDVKGGHHVRVAVDQAIRIVLRDARVAVNLVYNVDVKLDPDEQVYEIEIKSRRGDYTYQIHAGDGTIKSRDGD